MTFTNPYNRSVRIVDSKNDYFNFSQRTRFLEKLRIDISQFEIKSLCINATGEILLFAGNRKIIKLNQIGELVFEKDIEIKKGFHHFFGEVPTGIISGTNNFFVNNWIITSDNEFLELQLPVQELKKGKLQSSNIGDLVFWESENKYLVIYENRFLTYNSDLQLEKSIDISQKWGSKILIEKEWILTQKRDKALIILNFEGVPISTYEYGNGNNQAEFSPNYEYLVCFYYSTKSQFFDLKTGKKSTLWAHPTFVKGYKEAMYSDIENNFGMSIAKFSPDNKYIVGGAYHGKYVTWTLPKLERKELIPKDEMIDLLEPLKTSWFANGESGVKVTKAEKVILNNQTFLKNRRNQISEIFFFEGGDIFVTEIGYGNYVLSWDRNFNNLTHKKIDGRLDYHSEKYLSQRSNSELVIYEQ